MEEGMDIYYAYNEIFRFCVYVINRNLLFNKLWLWEVYPIEFWFVWFPFFYENLIFSIIF